MNTNRPQTARPANKKSSIILDTNRPKSAKLDRRVSFHFPGDNNTVISDLDSTVLGNPRSFTTEQSSLGIDLDDFEIVPDNPALWMKKPRPQSSPATISTRKNDFSKSRLEYIPPSSLRTQTVRTNLEKYQIEQTTLRRIRFLIESHTAQPTHLSMLSVLEYSSLPGHIIQSIFGQEFKTLYSVKVLLCRVIDQRNKSLGRPQQPTESLCHEEIPRPSRPCSARTHRPTTPQPILDILENMETEKKKPKKVNWRKVDEKLRKPEYMVSKSNDCNRQELLGSLLLSKKLGIVNI